MKKIFVSGCFDIIHAGHIQFFSDAKAHGDHLTVCFASNATLSRYKGRKAALPEEHRKRVLQSLSMVDEVVMGTGTSAIFNFLPELGLAKPDMLISTEDDGNADAKEVMMRSLGIEYKQIPKQLDIPKISTTDIRAKVKEVPLRIDFAGGWLDMPKYARKGAFVVNCAISPLVSLTDWPYELKAGLGGSAAYALLSERDPIQAELDLGVGWQDPAVILETGLCVWRSGEKPILEAKINPDFLEGHLALYWTGTNHDTPSLSGLGRDYFSIEEAGYRAMTAAVKKDLLGLAEAVNYSYHIQRSEGMEELPDLGELAKKYCGGGWGGYALYIFSTRPKRDDLINIEPYVRHL